MGGITDSTKIVSATSLVDGLTTEVVNTSTIGIKNATSGIVGGELIYIDSSGVTQQLNPGTSGQYLQTQGDAVAPAWADLSVIPSFTDKFIDNTLNLSYWGVSNVGTGTTAVDTTSCTCNLSTGATLNGTTTLSLDNEMGADLEGNSPVKKTLEFELYIDSGIATYNGLFGWGNTANPSATIQINNTFTSNKAKVYCTNAGGNSQSAEFTLTKGQWNKIKLVHQTNSLKCYVNGTLVVTHTTNVPTMAQDTSPVFYLSNETTNGDMDAYLNYVNIKVEYT